MVTESMNADAMAGKLLDALASVDRPGEFCVSGDLPMTMPGLEVDGFGAVGLPLNGTQARKLIKRCRQAPYGQGSETIVDTDVRNVRELDPQEFQLTGPEWDSLITSVVERVQGELGLADVQLTADLYKLLVYEKGSFFLSHRDSEKLDGMVATLVIGLPSRHTGGELVVRHDGWEYEVAMAGAASGNELSFAAFYADCEHEIRALESGCRLCLVYNVSLAKSRGKRRRKAINAPSYADTTETVSELFNEWRQGGGGHKIAVTLQHRYTQGGLSRDALKGTDRAWADVLFEAAEQAECEAYLAQLTRYQDGMPGNWYELEQRARGGFYSATWDAEKDGTYRGDTSLEDVYEEALTLDGWSDAASKRVRFGKIGLDQSEIIADPPCEEWTPAREEYEGYTGNEGITVKRWYHRAAIVVWPRDRQFAVLCDAGTAAAIGGLDQMVKRLAGKAKSRRSDLRDQCISFADAIMDAWKPPEFRGQSWGSGTDGPDEDQARAEFPRLLSVIDEPGLGSRYLADVLASDAAQQIDTTFVSFLKRHGWDTFEPVLLNVIDATTDATLMRNARLLQTVATQRDRNAARIAVGQTLAERLVARLRAVDAGSAKSGVRAWMRPKLDRSELLSSLVKGLVSVSADGTLQELIDDTLGSEQYDLTEVHIAAIDRLKAWLERNVKSPNAAIATWLEGCRTRLEELTSRKPDAPGDYRRADTVTCKCRDCAQLKAFLVNPDASVARFPLANQRRQHLQQIINRHKCDTTHVTERRGRPQTLVCTKTTASYDAACHVFERDCANLQSINRLQKRLP